MRTTVGGEFTSRRLPLFLWSWTVCSPDCEKFDPTLAGARTSAPSIRRGKVRVTLAESLSHIARMELSRIRGMWGKFRPYQSGTNVVANGVFDDRTKRST